MQFTKDEAAGIGIIALVALALIVGIVIGLVISHL